MTGADRKARFLERAGEMYAELAAWSEEHEEASSGDIEQVAREHRRELMDETLAILINGRDTGMQAILPQCPPCEGAMKFQGYSSWTIKGIEGDTELEHASYTCPQCDAETLFPLDRQLRLRADHWSDGLARIAARQGLPAPSFAQAVEAVTEAVGRSIATDSVRRLTAGFGGEVGREREAEVARVVALSTPGETEPEALIPAEAALVEWATGSTDGRQLLVRGEGWKEFKLTAISEIGEVTGAAAEAVRADRRRDAPGEPVLK